LFAARFIVVPSMDDQSMSSCRKTLRIEKNFAADAVDVWRTRRDDATLSINLPRGSRTDVLQACLGRGRFEICARIPGANPRTSRNRGGCGGSAEAAIEYLTRNKPDVIFMDHMMPGMDGFQAVQSIKNNPRTSAIPILMYTSQEGDLYAGQARALGADGVLPKQIKQSDVTKMLFQLQLVSDAAAPSAPRSCAWRRGYTVRTCCPPTSPQSS
jgi:CheY-like chemotaxis protein